MGLAVATPTPGFGTSGSCPVFPGSAGKYLCKSDSCPCCSRHPPETALGSAVYARSSPVLALRPRPIPAVAFRRSVPGLRSVHMFPGPAFPPLRFASGTMGSSAGFILIFRRAPTRPIFRSRSFSGLHLRGLCAQNFEAHKPRPAFPNAWFLHITALLGQNFYCKNP